MGGGGAKRVEYLRYDWLAHKLPHAVIALAVRYELVLRKRLAVFVC